MKDVLEHLKTERLSRGWTLKDVSDRTGISITVLKALESGNSDRLVAASAVEGLYRKYSAALETQAEQTADHAQKSTGTDVAKSRNTFRYIMTGLLLSVVFAAVFLAGTVFRHGRQTEDSSVKSHEPAASQTGTASSIRPQQETPSGPESLPARQETLSGHEDLPPQHRELPEVEKQAPGPPASDVNLSSVPKSEQDAVPSAEPDAQSVASLQPPANVRPVVRPVHSFEIVTDQRTWIQVVVDGKKAETELLEAGQSRKWQALDKVDLVVGNGGGVRLQWDGKPVDISSGRGRVVRLSLPKP